MPSEPLVLGIDFGTDSVRIILVNASTGLEMATSSFLYPRWKAGLYCDITRNQFRQHPLDYIEGIEQGVKACLMQVSEEVRRNIRGIGIATTGSTPVAVDKSGLPLSLLPEFAENPNAMFVLWKDHTSIKEAGEINLHAPKFPINYLQYVGGVYSSEWFWAKLLHILRIDESVRNDCYTWVEHCDWIPFMLTGGTKADAIKRGVCSAGHKGLWSEYFRGYPPDSFFSSLDPLLKGYSAVMSTNVYTADEPAGHLCSEWATRLGLSQNVVVAIGAFDAHMGAVGGQIEPYYLSKVMGTSTCDILVAPVSDMKGKLVKGICGQVNGSVIPGMTGMEAGQSAFGDAYAWFKNLFIWSQRFDNMKYSLDDFLPELSREAEKIPLKLDSELAIDWFNGRRTPDANQELRGAILGISLASDAPALFRAVVEATCFGAKAIINRFISENIPIHGLIGLGGVAKKSPFIMQMMADITGIPIRIHKSEQTCALGAAMFAATASDVYENVESAMAVMGSGFEKTYFPNPSKWNLYEKRYLSYHAFGREIEKQTVQIYE